VGLVGVLRRAGGAPTKDALLARAIEDGLVRPSEVAVYTSWAFRETT